MSTSVTWEHELQSWLDPFLTHLHHPARRRMCPLYVAGLIGPGERKSLQPMAARLAPADYDQLHHFVAVGPWDEAPLEAELLAQAERGKKAPRTTAPAEPAGDPGRPHPAHAGSALATCHMSPLPTIARADILQTQPAKVVLGPVRL